MPTYNADPSKVSANLEVFPKGDYEFIIGEPKAFAGVGKNGPNWGVRYTLTCVSEGEMKGKKLINSLYEHSEAAKPINKRFILAAMGYGQDKKSETRFNADFEGADWSFDTDSGAVGDAWRQLTGKRVVASTDVKLGDNGSEQQGNTNWRAL